MKSPLSLLISRLYDHLLLPHLLLPLLFPAAAALAKHRGVSLRVEAVAGREAVLPCEVGKLDSSDMVFVVLWYKNGDKEPMYSYDNRPGRLVGPEQRHTLRSHQLEGRATFRPGQIPALHIRPVLAADQANYTCRVDFRIASSRRTYLSLWVVEPPGTPVMSVDGRRVAGGVLEPLQEGHALVLTCSVKGGVPPPTVTWTRDGQVLDALVESRGKGMTVNQLTLPTLTRDYHKSHLACLADNNNVTSPASTSLTLVMNLLPLVTRLEHPPRSLRVGREYQILCVTAGSRPHPNITWTLGNVAFISPLVAETQHGVNMSSSRVGVRASRRHHGQRLSCTALNPLFPDHPLADSLILNVTYPPVASMELGGRASSVVIREGQDATFTCNVDANPPSYKTNWFLQDTPIDEGPGVGLSISSLALRRVTRHQAGPYTCSASNVEGDARSAPLNLTVNYAPVCENPPSGEPLKVYAAVLGRAVNISCRVLASPLSVRFSWVFNNFVSSERLPEDQVFTMADGRSVAQFRPKMNQELGTMQCWAENTVGRMTEPCIFQVVPAGRPEAPTSCSVVKKTYDSLVVTCAAAFDGGLQQSFSARVFESVTGMGQVNVTSHLPHFTFDGLTPGLDYLIEVMAHNELGASNPITLEAFTYKMAENRMRKEKVEEVTSSESENKQGARSGWLLTQAMLVGGAATVVVVVLGVLTAVVRRVVNRRGRHHLHNHHHHPDFTTSATTVTTTTAAAATSATSATTPASFTMNQQVLLETPGSITGQIGSPYNTGVSLELSDLLLTSACTPLLPPLLPPAAIRKLQFATYYRGACDSLGPQVIYSHLIGVPVPPPPPCPRNCREGRQPGDPQTPLRTPAERPTLKQPCFDLTQPPPSPPSRDPLLT